MTIYEDDTMTVTRDGITIHSYRWKGDARHIPAGSIRGVERFEMGPWSGKYRLVGIGFGRPRTWFAFGKSRANTTTALELDTGSLIKPAVVPDDVAAVAQAVGEITS